MTAFLKPFGQALVFVSFCTTAFFTAGCSKNKTDTPKSEIARFVWTAQVEGTATIKVINQYGEPVQQAQILIGSSQGAPFKENFVTTDAAGIAKIPADWATPEHVTVDAAGFIRQTLLNQKPGDITIKLSPLYLANRPIIKGQITNLPVVNGDKQIDFALVTPAMTRQDLLNFDMNAVISPYSDEISVIGQKAKIPGNVSLPTQKESYIIGITLSKPIYRLTSTTLGPKRYAAVRGQFPFKKVIDQMNGGAPFHDLVNLFSIQGGGMRDVTLAGQLTTIDFPGNELVYSAKIKTQPAAAKADEVLMIVAVSEIADSLVPTDIKKSTGEASLTLSSLPNKPAFIVNAIKRQAEFDPAAAAAPGSDRVSAGISPHNETIKPKLLPLVENPSVTTTNGYKILLPNKPVQAGINGIATSASISDLVEVQNGDTTILNVNRRWEILGLGWESQIELPKWPLANGTTRQRIEINFIGSTTHESVNLDDQLIKAATHVTHSSTEL